MSQETKTFDYIIVGGGCAGLSLALAMLDAGIASHRFAIVERQPAKGNDRTWCFWTNEATGYESIFHKTWDRALIRDHNQCLNLDISPYRYAMIKGEDFYRFAHQQLQAQQVNIFFDDIEEVTSDGFALGKAHRYQATRHIFDSISTPPGIDQHKGSFLWQHFKGYFIRSETDVFTPDTMTYMDFRVPQQDGVCFAYILPSSEREALVEFTLFGQPLWVSEMYDTPLQDYIARYIGGAYEVVEEEIGKIPMTDYVFPSQTGKRVPIGTVGGFTKASTGFTFLRTQELCRSIAKQLANNQSPNITPSPFKYRMYDRLMLDVLQHERQSGTDFFMSLFQKNDVQSIFKFLDEKTSFAEELSIMASTDLRAFVPALGHQLVRG